MDKITQEYDYDDKSKMVSYTAEELSKLKGDTDWERVRNMTDEEICAAIDSDPDAEYITEEDWKNAVLVRPKRAISIRLDSDIVEYFKSLGGKGGKGYQTRINETLRKVMKSTKSKSKPKSAK